MVARVDAYAHKMGVSRSALCSMFVGQGIMAYDRSMDVITLLGEKLIDDASQSQNPSKKQKKN